MLAQRETDAVNFTSDRALHSVAVVLSAMTLLLLVAGALVTSNDAGDSVPDWPLSFGRWLIQSNHFVANVRYEYSHRVIAAAVAVMTAVVAILASTNKRPRLIRKLALTAFAGVLTQALLGGARVLFPASKPIIAVIHALVAQSFFGLIVALIVLTSGDWWNARQSKEDARFPSTRWLATASVGAVLMQLVLGAGFRHGALPIAPHVLGAIVVSSLLVWTAIIVLRRYADDVHLRRPALVMLGLVSCQVALGILAYGARLKSHFDAQPLEPMISLTVAHVVSGALTLASVVVLTLRSWLSLSSPGERRERTEWALTTPGNVAGCSECGSSLSQW